MGPFQNRRAEVDRRRRKNRGALGAEGVEYEEGAKLLPSRLGDLGERCELPQRGPGRSPTANDFGAFWA